MQVCSPAANEMCGQAFPEDVEVFGPLPALLVAVGRADADVDHRTLGIATLDLGVDVGRTLHRRQRGLVAQALLDGRRHQFAVGLDRPELLGVGEQQVDQVARRPVGGLQTGGSSSRRKE